MRQLQRRILAPFERVRQGRRQLVHVGEHGGQQHRLLVVHSVCI